MSELYITAKEIAAALNKQGVKTGKVSEPDETEDGMIEIDDQVHVQVGEVYANVVRENNGSYVFAEAISTARNSVDVIASRLKKQISLLPTE